MLVLSIPADMFSNEGPIEVLQDQRDLTVAGPVDHYVLRVSVDP